MDVWEYWAPGEPMDADLPGKVVTKLKEARAAKLVLSKFKRRADAPAPSAAAAAAPATAVAAAAPAGEVELAQQQAPRGGWEEVTDRASGCAYYVHSASGRVQWERPPELGD